MEPLTIPQSFVLLLTDADGRRSGDPTAYDAGLAGAVLADLALGGQVTLADGRVAVLRGASHPADPVLSGSLGLIATESKPRAAKWWVTRLRGRELRDGVAMSLVERGLLSEQQRRVLGLFPATSYPEADGGPEAQLRASLTDVLAGRATPTPQLAAIVALLDATKTLRNQFGAVPKETVQAVVEGSWAAPAVTAVLADVQAAAIAAVVAATSAATTAAVTS